MRDKGVTLLFQPVEGLFVRAGSGMIVKEESFDVILLFAAAFFGWYFQDAVTVAEVPREAFPGNGFAASRGEETVDGGLVVLVGGILFEGGDLFHGGWQTNEIQG